VLSIQFEAGVRRSVSDISGRERQWSLRRLLIGMFVLATVVAGGWLLREPVLVGAGNLWIVSDPIRRADAIVDLGGGLQIRPKSWLA
jgi:hypothetical protein